MNLQSIDTAKPRSCLIFQTSTVPILTKFKTQALKSITTDTTEHESVLTLFGPGYLDVIEVPGVGRSAHPV